MSWSRISEPSTVVSPKFSPPYLDVPGFLGSQVKNRWVMPPTKTQIYEQVKQPIRSLPSRDIDPGQSSPGVLWGGGVDLPHRFLKPRKWHQENSEFTGCELSLRRVGGCFFPKGGGIFGNFRPFKTGKKWWPALICKKTICLKCGEKKK